MSSEEQRFWKDVYAAAVMHGYTNPRKIADAAIQDLRETHANRE